MINRLASRDVESYQVTFMERVSISDVAEEFSAYGGDHLGALGVAALAGIAMCWVARSGGFPRLERAQRFGLAVLLILIFPLSLLAGKLSLVPLGVSNSLPMHLCDWAAITAFFALLWKKPLLCEMTYFWGLAGKVQGLLTPDIAFGFPDAAFLIFFLHHGGVVLAALYIVLGLRFTPRPGAVLRMFLWTQFYVVVAALTNLALGSNYGYLRAKPIKASLLDVMGDWPWYILVLETVCLVLFLLLNLPFVLARRKGRDRSKNPLDR
jgi:hypothetical integral membrane protein (TIGR02206 family)